MKLHLESLEDRRALAAYTTHVLDPNNLVPADVESKMLRCLDFAVRNISNFVSWKGTLDARIQILPSRPDFPQGVLSAITSTMPGNRNAAIYEMTTGTDPYPNDPDCGANVWLAQDGTVKVHGMGAYYDPDPCTYVPSDVPSGMIDFIGGLTHEIFHGIAVRDTVEFGRYLGTVGGNTFFNGPNTLATLGQPLPYVGGGHYGNTSLPNNPIGTGLMFQWGNYERNRLDIGKLDLAILRDVGLSTTNTVGLPLVDRIDSQMPKNLASGLAVNENVPLGTTVATLSTTLGSAGFSFSLPDLRDNRYFRIVGKALVTNSPLDYEARNSYTIEVRNTDSSGVWTDTVMKVVVRDVDETPKIVAPGSVLVGGSVGLGFVGVYGDANAICTVSVFAKTGSFKSAVNDPSVRVYFGSPWSGGRMVFVMGSPEAVSRNMKYVTYTGNDTSLSVSLGARLGDLWITDQKNVALDRLSVRSPVMLPGKFSSLRV